MNIDPVIVVAILGMAAAAYLTRVAGIWLVRRIGDERRARRWLDHVPGAVLAALVAPMLLRAGLLELAAAAVTGWIAIKTKSLLPALAAGLLTIMVLRRLL